MLTHFGVYSQSDRPRFSSRINPIKPNSIASNEKKKIFAHQWPPVPWSECTCNWMSSGPILVEWTPVGRVSSSSRMLDIHYWWEIHYIDIIYWRTFNLFSIQDFFFQFCSISEILLCSCQFPYETNCIFFALIFEQSNFWWSDNLSIYLVPCILNFLYSNEARPASESSIEKPSEALSFTLFSNIEKRLENSIKWSLFQSFNGKIIRKIGIIFGFSNWEYFFHSNVLAFSIFFRLIDLFEVSLFNESNRITHSSLLGQTDEQPSV